MTVCRLLSYIPVKGAQSKLRPRVTMHGTYTPKKVVQAENELRMLWQHHRGNQSDYTGELRVLVEVTRELPKSAAAKRLGEPDVSRPDADNYAKLVLDALNGLAWHDDSQITELVARKLPRTKHGSGDRIDIKVYYIDEKGKEESSQKGL
jgi:Holliday junction resolvase RusA-like endonuclease